MKKSEKPEFDEFMLDEAIKFGRALTQPEIDTWFANFPSKSLREFRAAWLQHKRDEKRGRYFPEIIDIQRALKATNDAQESRDDHRCIWNGNGDRCRYPVGFFAQGSHEGYCCFHRAVMSGPGAQVICDDSQSHTPEQYVERAKQHAYSGKLSDADLALQERTARVQAAHRAGNPLPRFVIPIRAPEPGDEAVDERIAAADLANMDAINSALRDAEEAA